MFLLPRRNAKYAIGSMVEGWNGTKKVAQTGVVYNTVDTTTDTDRGFV